MLGDEDANGFGEEEEPSFYRIERPSDHSSPIFFGKLVRLLSVVSSHSDKAFSRDLRCLVGYELCDLAYRYCDPLKRVVSSAR